MSPKPVVCFGEMLWDVLPSGARPGGAPMNVAYHLQKLGLPTAIISRVANDDRGRGLLQLLKQNGITTAFVQQDDQHQTGVVLATLNERAEATYEIVQPVAWDFIVYNEALKNLVRSAPYFVFGSLAARSETSRQTLFQLLEEAPVKVLDINLRAPHFTRPLLENLLQHCDILKINDQELPLIAGWYGDLKEADEQMALLQNQFHINTIVTTCGPDGALLLHSGTVYRHAGFKVQVKDTIGSGDAFLAALLFSLHNGMAPAAALEFANGLGAFVASSDGACPEYDVENVRNKTAAHFA